MQTGRRSPRQVITSRMRYISSTLEEAGGKPMRIVGLCTSLANTKDLGDWIGATSHGLFNFPPGAPRAPRARDAKRAGRDQCDGGRQARCGRPGSHQSSCDRQWVTLDKQQVH
jgi:hypothetical protein